MGSTVASSPQVQNSLPLHWTCTDLELLWDIASEARSRSPPPVTSWAPPTKSASLNRLLERGRRWQPCLAVHPLQPTFVDGAYEFDRYCNDFLDKALVFLLRQM